MRQVNESPRFPYGGSGSPMDLAKAFGGLIKQISELFFSYGYRLNRVLPADGSEPAQSVAFTALSADPAAPAAGRAVIWLSDGTGAGDDGDLMIKVTDTGGTTKTGTLIDFSAI